MTYLHSFFVSKYLTLASLHHLHYSQLFTPCWNPFLNAPYLHYDAVLKDNFSDSNRWGYQNVTTNILVYGIQLKLFNTKYSSLYTC